MRKVGGWGAAGLALAAILGLPRILPVQAWLEGFVRWADQMGAVGALIFGAVFMVGIVVCIWGGVFALVAGMGFGFEWGLAVSVPSLMAGSTAAFLIARYVARGPLERWARAYPKFRALDEAVAERGWQVVVLIRFSPLVLFNVSNYLLGLTRIRFTTFLWASFLAGLPGTVLYVYMGYLGQRTLMDGLRALGTEDWVVVGGAVVVMAATSFYLGRVARAALKAERDGN